MAAFPDPSNMNHHDPIEHLLARRGERLAHRPGLTARVLAAVEAERALAFERDRSSVLAVIGPGQWRRSLAAAAALLLACGLTATMVLRTEPTIGGARPTRDLVVADGSHAERLLLALISPLASDPGSAERASIDEVIPAAGIRFQDLDQEMERIIDAPLGAGEVRR